MAASAGASSFEMSVPGACPSTPEAIATISAFRPARLGKLQQ
jgi:hypothetical protein